MTMEDLFNLDKTWEELKEKIKELNFEITNDDLDFKPGREDELYENLSRKLHKTKEEVKAWIGSVSATKAIAG